jgi:lipid-binding SYLF domain-containing protein
VNIPLAFKFWNEFFSILWDFSPANARIVTADFPLIISRKRHIGWGLNYSRHGYIFFNIWLSPCRITEQESMKKGIALAIILLLTVPTFGAEKSREKKRLEACGEVLKEILDIPDDIPKDLLNKAECVIVIPSVFKFAIGVGGDFGRGAITCRTGEHYTGPWSAPALFALEGGNIGFQLGGQATDFVLLVMNAKGATSILGSKVKLGADASAAAGPKGRTAAADTDIVMRAEVLSYSRSRGLFAGISLEGSTLRSDGSANRKLYGRELSAKEIVREHKVGVPASGRELVGLLDKQSPKNHSDPVSLK